MATKKQVCQKRFNYWGKADPAYPHEQKWHPLAYHSLDVAAVGVAYLQQYSLLITCCRFLKCNERDFLSWSGFFLALHDLGKFSEAFQAQRRDLVLVLQKREPDMTKTYNERHDSLGFWLWDEYLVDEVLPKIGIEASHTTQRSLKCFLSAVTGHHGMPPKPSGHADYYFWLCCKK
ncbi:MAG: CRISPR-associated endonuclease Cas3'' [Nitrosospira sp.]